MNKMVVHITKNKRAGQKGFILVSVYILLVVFVILGVALMSNAFAELHAAQRAQASTQAFYLAESALDQGLNWLRSQPSPPPGITSSNPLGSYQSLGSNDGSYLFTLNPFSSNLNSFTKRYTLSGEGEIGSQTNPLAVARTSLIVETASFARYAYFTNNETSPSGQTVWFVTGDHITGPTHTNGQFHISGQPIFDGSVTSASSTWVRYNSSANPLFNQGFTGGVPTIQYPNTFPPELISAANGAGGLSLTGNTTVTLVSNGTLRVTNGAKGWINKVVPVPASGVLYVNGGNITLSGTLKGQMTIAGTGDIQIPNSVRYSNDPRINPNSTDILGLLAGNNVRVMSSAPSNVEIDASIMALNTSFTVQNYSSIALRGNLTVYGGIIQAKRGPVGTFGSNGLRNHGYGKDYHWDPRFSNMSPPYFPTTGDYVIRAWEEE